MYPRPTPERPSPQSFPPPSGRALSGRHRAPRSLAAALVLAAALLAGTTLAGAQDAAEEREAVRERRDRLADELDVLEATDDEVDAALDEVEAAIAAQEAAVDAALAARAEAEAEVRGAEARLRVAERDVEVLEAAIAEMAVASYVHPPTADLLQSLQADTLSDALVQQIYLDARARRDLNLLDVLEVAQADAEAATRAVAERLAAADEAAAAADAQLDALRAERDAELAFAERLHVRIDAALAEAAVLADLDATLASQIAAEQAALIERIPAAPVADVPVTADAAPPAAPAPTVPPVTPGPTTPPPAPPTTSPPAPTTTLPAAVSPTTTTTTRPPTTTTTPPTSGGSGGGRPSTPEPPLATVRGFTVHAAIAGDVEAMLAAAEADGLTFGGGAYRSTQRQIELRRAHCGPTEYDIWERPASQCSPPTAVPGRSLHEQGRAIDFTYQGRLITSRDNAGFRWLADHAASYGFYNLPSEPWHWSTTGG